MSSRSTSKCCSAEMLGWCCAGCRAGHPLRSLLEDSKAKLNITVKADNVCLRDSVQEGKFNYYALDISGCFEDPTNSYLAVEARVYPADPGCESCQEWSMLVNTEGELPTYQDLSDADSGTFLDFVGKFRLKRLACNWGLKRSLCICDLTHKQSHCSLYFSQHLKTKHLWRK